MIAALIVAAVLADTSPQDGAAQSTAVIIQQAIDQERLTQAQAMLGEWRAATTQQTTATSTNEGSGEQDREFSILSAELTLAQRRNEQAMAAFQALATQGVRDCRVDEGLGIAYLRLNQGAAAMEPLARATHACPQRWQGWNGYGVALDLQHRWDESRAAYDAAYRLVDRPAGVMNNFGFSLLMQGKPDQAARLFAAARAADPDNMLYANNEDMARVMAGQKLTEPDMKNSQPDDWGRRLSNAGYVAMRMGRNGEAEAYLSRSITESDRYFAQAAANLEALKARPQ